MRLLWNLAKFVLALVLIVPVCIVVLALTLGILGTLFGLAVFALKVAFAGLIVYGAFRLMSHLFGGPSVRSRPREIPGAAEPMPRRDRYEEEALRELDRELGVR